MMPQHRPTHEVKIFLHMNLPYELIKHVKRNAILTSDQYDPSMPFLTTELAYALSMLKTAMFRHVVAPWCCGCTFSICATH